MSNQPPSRIYFGIDPGKAGAIVALDHDGQVLSWTLSPSGRLLYTLLETWKPRAVFLEKAQTMPKQGIVSAFTYGCGFGELIAAMEIYGVAYHLVPPRHWTMQMHKGTNSCDAPKYRSSTAFRRLWSDVAPQIANGAGRLHEGVVDAALIALYGVKHL
jgi:hypothetical protein